MSNTPTTTTTPIAGLATTHLIYGEGTPVLALHGWGVNHASFWPVAEQLARFGYCIYTPDMPGFGETAPPPQPWGVPDYAAWVLAYLDAHDLDRVHLFGHSFGGRVSLILGAEHPDRIDKIVLANSAGIRAPGSPLRDGLVKAAKGVLSLPGLKTLYEPLRRRYYEQIGATDYLHAGSLKETFVKVIEQDLRDYAARVARPTLLIWGDQDEDTPLWQGQLLEQLIPDAGLVVFNGAGHYSYLDRLSDYLRIVTHFLADDSEQEKGGGDA